MKPTPTGPQSGTLAVVDGSTPCGIAGCPLPAEPGRTIAVAVTWDTLGVRTLAEVVVVVCGEHHSAIGFTTAWVGSTAGTVDG